MCTYLSVWRSHNRLYTPVDCPPSGNTRRLWPAASYIRHRRSSAGDTRSPAPSGPPVSAGCPADTQRTWSRISCRQNTAKHRSDGTRSVSVNDMKPCKCWNTKDWLEEVVFAVDAVASTEAFVGQLRLTVAAFQTFTVPLSIQNLQDKAIDYVLVTARANWNICKEKNKTRKRLISNRLYQNKMHH